MFFLAPVAKQTFGDFSHIALFTAMKLICGQIW